jgi:hypothetical protein
MSDESVYMKALRFSNVLQRRLSETIAELKPLFIDLMTPPVADDRRDPWASQTDVPVSDTVTCEGIDCRIRRDPQFMIKLTIPYHETRYFHNEECLRNAG